MHILTRICIYTFYVVRAIAVGGDIISLFLFLSDGLPKKRPFCFVGVLCVVGARMGMLHGAARRVDRDRDAALGSSRGVSTIIHA